MRRILVLAVAVLALPVSALAEEPSPAPAAEPAPAPVVAPAVKNVSLGAKLAFGDGTFKDGRIAGIERAVDVYGEEGWSAEAKDLVLEVEIGTTEKAVPWTEVKSLTITTAPKPEFDCDYTSETSPWMYECRLSTTSTVVLKSGQKGNVITRKRWRFTYEDGTSVVFSAFKPSAHEPDPRELSFGEEVGENAELYAKLQGQLRAELKAKMVKGVTITP